MELVSIGVGSHRLNSDAAASFARMVADGMPTGTINTSTRSHALQTSWYKNQGKPGYPKYADHPDRSKHVWRPDAADKGARALDVATDSPMHAWLIKHGKGHGWFRRIKVEPWHWEYESQHDLGVDDMATPIEIWGYKNPNSKDGTKDAYLLMREGKWAAEEARAIAKRTEGKIDAIIAALANSGAGIDIDSLASKVADAVGPEIADDVANELDAREKARLNQVTDA